MFHPSRSLLGATIGLMFFTGIFSLHHVAAQDGSDTDLTSLVLVQADLQDAKRGMTIHDVDEDGFIDSSEQKKLAWARDVPKYDLNKDGDQLLTISELAVLFSKARREVGVSTKDEVKARQIVRSRDFNGDGQISGQELTLEGIELAEGSQPVDYSMYDANKDKTITVAEVAKYLAAEKKEKGFGDEDLATAFKLVLRHDQNRNGHIDKEELDDGSEVRPGRLTSKILAKADEDQDGRISRDELARHLARESK